MTDPRTDQIAREAARLIETCRAENIDAAIRAAAGNPNLRGAPLPSMARVRKHAKALHMQAIGELKYNLQRIEAWRIAEQIMSTLEHLFPDARTIVAGRAAAGHFDADPTVHIRTYTDNSISHIAQALVERAYEEPEFRTAETKYGRLSQIRFTEESIEVVITRCPRSLAAPTNIDLFTGKRIDTLHLNDLRRQIKKATKDLR